jgi:hypothetical protein
VRKAFGMYGRAVAVVWSCALAAVTAQELNDWFEAAGVALALVIAGVIFTKTLWSTPRRFITMSLFAAAAILSIFSIVLAGLGSAWITASGIIVLIIAPVLTILAFRSPVSHESG